MTKAFVRDQLIEEQTYPVILIGGAYKELPEDWAKMYFLCLQPDEWDEREWNLILVHPYFGVFFGNSIDWDFTD